MNVKFNSFFPFTLYGKIHLYLMDRPSVKCVIRFFFVFHLNSMKIDEVVVIYRTDAYKPPEVY